MPHTAIAQPLSQALFAAETEAGYRSVLDAIDPDNLAAKLDAKDEHGNTPLMNAAKALNFGLFDVLAEYGADPNTRDANNRNILNIAIRSSSPTLARHALAAGTDPKALTIRMRGSTLTFDSDRGEVEIVKLLIEAGAPLDRVNINGWTALLEATVLGDGGPDYQDIVRQLLEAGADATIADKGGMTPFDHAVRRGHTEIAQILRSAR